MNARSIQSLATLVTTAWLAIAVPMAQGTVVFSYNSTTGQFPTDQGWGAFEIDTTGPLTAPATAGTSAANANAAIELVGGVNTLHIRDTLSDSTADLPNYYYPWTTTQQQQLINSGLKFTFVFQTLNATGGNTNVRFGFNNTLFETQLDNITADQKIAVEGLQALAPQDGQFHTLVITGTPNGPNMDFARTIDGGAPVVLTPATNNSPAGSVIEPTVYFGAFSSGGIQTDILVRSATMETLNFVPDQLASLVRTPGSSYGSLTITNNTAALNIVGYTVRSAVGALKPANWTSIDNAYDLSGNHSVDPDDEWTTLSNAASRDNLSEFEPNGNGATWNSGQSVSLGNVWIQNPTEDVAVDLLLADGSVVTVPGTFTGNGGNKWSFGDLNFDGVFNATDFTAKFVPSYGTNTSTFSAAEKYQAGDFNSDGVVGLTDFLIYNEAYRVANPSLPALNASLLGVPEPAAWGMACTLAGAGFFTRRGRRSSRNLAVAAWTLLAAAACCGNALAATRIAYWKMDETAGATTAVDSTGGGHTAVRNGSPTAGVAGKIGNAWSFSGATTDYLQVTTAPTSDTLLTLGETFSYSAWFKTTTTSLSTIFTISDNTVTNEEVVLRAAGDQGPAGFGSADLVGRPGIGSGEAVASNPTNDGKWHFVTFAQNTTGWTLYVDGKPTDSGLAVDGLASAQAIGADVSVIGSHQRGGSHLWNMNGLIDDLAVWNDRLTDADVLSLYVGGLVGVGADTPFSATLALEVNQTTGAVSLKNSSAFSFEIDAYRVHSNGGSLTPGTWNSLDAQNLDSGVWTQFPGTINEAAEGALAESTVLAGPTTAISLGNLFDKTKNIHDLSFDFHLVGSPVDLLIPGTVTYVTSAADSADFNSSGKVDGADFLIWQRGFGVGTTKAQGDANNSGSVNGADLTVWKTQFGTAGSNAVVAGVPEPAGWALAAASVAVIAARRRRRIVISCLAALGLVASLATLSSATVFNDRTYLLGDDPAEGAALNATLGSGNGFGTTFDSANAPGSGDLQDLLVRGAPKYVSVSDRPGATGGALGAQFNGTTDYLLTPINFAVPSSVWDDSNYFASPYPLNYEGINVQGMQMWVKPDASLQGVRQDIVKNSGEHGISIMPNNNWGLVTDVPEPTDSGSPVAFGQWSHVMQISGINQLPNGTGMSGGALFVNGRIVYARIATYEFHEEQPFTLGAQQFESDLNGNTPTAPENYFKGLIDDVNVFLWGQYQQPELRLVQRGDRQCVDRFPAGRRQRRRRQSRRSRQRGRVGPGGQRRRDDARSELALPQFVQRRSIGRLDQPAEGRPQFRRHRRPEGRLHCSHGVAAIGLGINQPRGACRGCPRAGINRTGDGRYRRRSNGSSSLALTAVSRVAPHVFQTLTTDRLYALDFRMDI